LLRLLLAALLLPLLIVLFPLLALIWHIDLPGLNKEFFTSPARGAGLPARFRHVAPLFVHFFLFLAGITEFLFRLVLLLLIGLSLTAAPVSAALALLVLLIALLGHHVLHEHQLNNVTSRTLF